MDHRSFDRLARLLGEARDRRTGLKALVGGLLGAGGLAALDDGADARRKGRGNGPDTGRKKKRKKCDPACDAGFTCVRGQCACASGVTCNGACCASGQTCRDGACADRPEPGSCLAFGEPCKNAGRPCCDGLSCASGQDGSFPVTCLRAKGAACESTAECPFGMSCQSGACIGVPDDGGDDGGGSIVPTGSPCASGDTCQQPGATCAAYTGDDAPPGEFCALPLRQVCTGDPTCTCYKCWYVNGGAEGTGLAGRDGRASLNTKACCHPAGQSCVTENDCCYGLRCNAGTCGGDMCVPLGGACADGACCDGLSCSGGACVVPPCTVTVSTFAELQTALATASTNSATAEQVICVTPGTYDFTTQLTGTSNSATNRIVIRKEGEGAAVFNGRSTWTSGAKPTTVDGNRILDLVSGVACQTTWNCAGFVIDGIDFRNGSTWVSTSTGNDGGCIQAKVNLTVRNAAFSRCASGYDGGAIYLDKGNVSGDTTLTLRNATFQHCYGLVNGGAVSTTSNLSMNGVTFTDNLAEEEGGAVVLRNLAALAMTDVTMTGNRVKASGAIGGAGISVRDANSPIACSGQETGPTTWSIADGQSGVEDCLIGNSASRPYPDATTKFAGCGCETTRTVCTGGRPICGGVCCANSGSCNGTACP